MVDENNNDLEAVNFLSVTISSTKGEIFKDDVNSLIAPGKEGILGVFPSHTKMVSLLKQGDIVIKRGSEEEDVVFSVDDGIIQVNRDDVQILVRQSQEI